MKNAHERFGWLDFEKQLKDTRTRLRVPLHRFISEPAENKEVSGTCHLVSVFGNDVDTQKGVGESASAVWKAVQEQHARLLPAAHVIDEELRENLVAEPFNEVVTVDGTALGLVFGARPEKESPRRRPLVVEPDCQLSLF